MPETHGATDGLLGQDIAPRRALGQLQIPILLLLIQGHLS